MTPACQSARAVIRPSLKAMPRAFDDDDWAFLVSLCDGAVRDAYARRGAAPPFTAAHVEARRRMDAYNAAFLRKLQAEVVASSDT